MGTEKSLLESIWCLYHRGAQTVIENLNLTQFQAIVSSIKSSDVPLWYFWRPGMAKWENIANVSTLQKPQAGSVRLQKPAPPPDKAPIISDDAPLDLRRSQRYSACIPLEVNFLGYILNNETVDISMGGCRLKNALPTRPMKEFEIVLKFSAKNALTLPCKSVSADETLTRIYFLPTPQLDVLREYLLFHNYPKVN